MNVFERASLPVTWKIHPDDLRNFVKEMRKLNRIISDPNMQLYRAKKFKDYVIEQVKLGLLDLKPLSDLTQIISNDGPHSPINATGNTLSEMGVKPIGSDAAEVGYWENSSGMLRNTAKKPITLNHWVNALHTGFRIPLTGDKGISVRTWFYHQHGITFPQSKQYIDVSPRPFMYLAIEKYINEGEDIKAVDEFLDKIANAPLDTTRDRSKNVS